jgi:hypothetical protein
MMALVRPEVDDEVFVALLGAGEGQAGALLPMVTAARSCDTRYPPDWNEVADQRDRRHHHRVRKLVFGIFALMARYEAALIQERRSGLAAARAGGREPKMHPS